MMRRSLITPSYAQGFARSQGDAQHPGLWRGLVGAWVPAMGSSGATLYDVSGYGNHGALTNMDPATDWVAGGKGTALDFDGSNDYVAVPHSDRFSFTDGAGNDTPFSIVANVNVADIVTRRPIVSKYIDASPFDGEWIFAYRETENLLGLHLVGTTSNDWIIAKSNAIGDVSGSEVQFAVTYDGSEALGGCKFYLNGNDISSGGGATSGAYTGMTNRGTDVEIGVQLRNGGTAVHRLFKGQMRDVYIFQRILAPAEITQLYMDPLAPFRLRDRRAFVFIAAVSGRTNLLEPRLLHGLLRR